MSSFRRLFRSEYLCQPAQLPRRLWRMLLRTNSRSSATIRLPWGFPIVVDPRESIGRSIVALNTLDLPVTESIWRLLDDGAACADIGANIGYMTSVMAARLPKSGTLHAFEPVPELFAALENNVGAWSALTGARIQLHAAAVSAKRGPAAIHVPRSFSTNRGLASLAGEQAGENTAYSIPIECVRLDDEFADTGGLELIKVDVEGLELDVFRGAENLLRQGRIRDILFEEHRPFEAESLRFLRGCGYTLFRVTRRMCGPGLDAPDCTPKWELDPPTYLATRDAGRARSRFAPGSWLSLGQK